MTDNPPLPPESRDGSIPASKRRQYLCIFRYGIPLILGGSGIWLLLCQAPWLIPNPSQQDIALIQSQMAALSHRIDQGEEEVKRLLPPVDPLKIKSMETALTDMGQKIEHLQEAVTRHPEGASPQLPLSQNLVEPLEKHLHHLAQAQQVFRSIILFWQLKGKILSDAPYLSELIAYKSCISGNGDLSSLEGHAAQGLGVFKDPPRREASTPDQTLPAPGQDQTSLFSWQQRLQAWAKSLVNVEKIEASRPLALPANRYGQNRKNVEAILARLEQALIHRLTTLSLPDLAASPE